MLDSKLITLKIFSVAMVALFASGIVLPATYSVTSTDVENAGTTPGDLANSINLANSSSGNSIIFNINSPVNYNAGAMPDITNLPMTIDGNGNTALSLKTSAAQLFNVTGATNAGTLTLTNMLSGLPILQDKVAISSGSSINFLQTSDGSYTNPITGSGSVILSLSGTTTSFSANSSYSGGTNFTSGGILIVGNNNALGSGDVTFSIGSIQTDGNRNLSNNFILSGAATLDGANNLTIGGDFDLSAYQLTSENSATVTLIGDISDGGSGGSIMQNNADGTLILSGNNTYTGGTTLTSGIISIVGGNALGTGSITMNGGTLQANTDSPTIANDFTLTNSSAIDGSHNLTINGTGFLGTYNLSIISTGGTLTFNGTISDTNASGSITLNGTNTTVLSSPNTYGGGTTVTSGTISLGDNAALGTGNLTMDGGSLQSSTRLNNISNNFILTASSFMLNGDYTFNGTGYLGSNSLTINNSGANTATFNGIISDGNLGGTIVKTGTGSLELNAQNTFTGGTTITAGMITVGDANALGTGTVTFNGGNLQSNADLSIANNYTFTADSYINQTASFPITLTGAGNLGAFTLTTPNNSSSPVTLAGIISDGGLGGSILNSGSGVLTLTGTNTYSGGTTNTGTGTLALGNSNALGTGLLTLDGGDLQAITDISIANNFALTANAAINGSNNLTITGAGNLGTSVLTISNTTGTITLSGIISDTSNTSGINMSVGGVLVLSGTNTFTGGVTLNGGTLIIGNASALGTGNLDFSGGTLQSNANFIITNNYSLSANSTISGTNDLTLSGAGNLNNRQLTVANTSGTITLSGIITDTSNASEIIMNGAGGTLLLSGANNNSGGVTITAGTVVVGNANALGTGAFTLDGGAIQSNTALSVTNDFLLTEDSTINGANDLELSGDGNLKSHILTVSNTNGTVTLSGTISDTSAASEIIMNGLGGTLLLSGANTNRGGITLTAGTLIVGNASSLGTGDLTLNGGTLQSNSSLTLANDFSLSANSTINGANDLTLSGEGNFNSSTLTVANTAGTITFNNTISGNGAMVLDGNLLILSGNNTYTGGTTISAGTLQLGTNNALASTGAVTINAGTFDLNGTTQTIGDLSGAGNIMIETGSLTFGTDTGSLTLSGAITGSGSLVKQGSGIVTFMGNNSFTGTTNINAGTLYVNGSLTGPVIVNSAATLGGSGTLGGDVTNSGIVSSSDFSSTSGAYGTLTISGNYSVGSTGTTTVEISPNGNTANIIVSGSANLDGALTVIADDPGDFILGTVYDLLTVGSLSGNFSSTPTQIANLQTSVVFDSTSSTFQLTLTGIGLNLSVSDSNESAVGNYINSLPAPAAGSDLAVTLGALGNLSPQQTANALQSISPGRLNSSTVVATDNFVLINNMISSRLFSLRGQNHGLQLQQNGFNNHRKKLLNTKMYGSPYNKSKLMQVIRISPTNNNTRNNENDNLWVNPFASYSNTNATNTDPRFNATTAGAAIGWDDTFASNLILGLGMGGYRSWVNVFEFPDRIRVDNMFAILYGTWFQSGYFVDFSFMGGLTEYNSKHYIAYGGINRLSSGRNNGGDMVPHLGIGREYLINETKVYPYASLDYIHIQESAYSLEGADSLDMNIQGKTANALYSSVGIGFAKTFTYNRNQITPEVELCYTYKDSHNGSMVASLIGEPGSFSVTNNSGSSYQISPSLGVNVNFYNGGFLQTSITCDFGPGYQAVEFNLLFGIEF